MIRTTLKQTNKKRLIELEMLRGLYHNAREGGASIPKGLVVSSNQTK